jgi:hypothetical protein
MLHQPRCMSLHPCQNEPALDTQADEPDISQVVKSAGFKRFRRAAEASFNIVYEVKS